MGNDGRSWAMPSARALRELLEKATPAPWTAFPMEKHALKGYVIDTAFGNNPPDSDYVIADCILGKRAEANAQLIALAPQLASAVLELREALEPFAKAYKLNDCDERDNPALEVSVSDLRKARDVCTRTDIGHDEH